MAATWARNHERVIAAGVWALGATIYFRDWFVSGFDTLTGDRGDARLAIFLQEHWFRWIRRKGSWNSPSMYFPTRNTLGYSDAYFLNMVVYAPSRAVGFDQFVAYELTLIALTAVGFAATFRILRHHLRVNIGAALVLAYVATFTNNLFVDSGHSQMYLVNIVPAVVLLGLETLQAERLRNRLLLAASTGLLFGLLAFSAFYIAWFGAVVAALVIVGVGITTSLESGLTSGLVKLWTAVRSRAGELVALIAGFGVAMIPFAATYLPVLDQTGGRSYAEVSNLAPLRGDLINVGRHNLLWGWIVTPLLDGDSRLDTLARAVAPTPIVLFLVAVAGWSLWRRRVRVHRSLTDTIGATTAIVVLVVWVLPVRFRVGSVWYWLYRFVPGGSAIRVPGRIEVLNSWLAAVAIGCWLATRARSVEADRVSERRAWQAWVVPVLLCLAATEQLNTTIGYRRFDRSDELAALSAVPPAPAACTAFAVIDPTRTEYDGVSIDAMLIAHEVGLPTVNGYSGQVPEGWTLRPWEEDYEASVTAWAVEHGLFLCSYNLATHAWSIPATPDL